MKIGFIFNVILAVFVFFSLDSIGKFSLGINLLLALIVLIVGGPVFWAFWD